MHYEERFSSRPTLQQSPYLWILDLQWKLVLFCWLQGCIRAESSLRLRDSTQIHRKRAWARLKLLPSFEGFFLSTTFQDFISNLLKQFSSTITYTSMNTFFDCFKTINISKWFCRGSQLDPTLMLKSVSWEQIVLSVKHTKKIIYLIPDGPGLFIGEPLTVIPDQVGADSRKSRIRVDIGI